jgi:hypothetical protein
MFQDGQRPGEFEILARLGQGGKGAVDESGDIFFCLRGRLQDFIRIDERGPLTLARKLPALSSGRRGVSISRG